MNPGGTSSNGEKHNVKAWSYGGSYGDMILESYRYAPGPAAELPKHAHEEYQFGLSLDFPGEYSYRGNRYDVPVGSLSVIHPGEMHSARDPEDRERPTTFKMMYASPDLLRAAAVEVASRETSHPFFANPIVLDEELAGLFLRLHAALEEEEAPKLEQDSRLLSVLARFVLRHADTRSSPIKPAGKERRAVRLVREYLEANHAENVSLEELASLANLSPFHLVRVFGEEVGLPPHAYQVGVRLMRAKELLLGGCPIAQVAQSTGFTDQSHLTRHFKRFVGVPPGSYARDGKNSKNVQYGRA